VYSLGVDSLTVAPRRPPDAVQLRLAYIGQISPHKGVHVLIDAVRQCPQPAIELVIHGDLTRDEPYAERLRKRATGDRRIHFAGPIARQDLNGLFQRVDVLVVPSIWYENSPMVIHEARSAGLPVIASGMGGMLELVRDEVDGLLAEPGSAESLARQLRRLIGDGSLLDRLREGVRRPTTIEEETKALIDVYKQAIGSRKPSSG
jgi:glycosyltransferase involved in cell wall biosynthesis